jgi:hypothetical protein
MPGRNGTKTRRSGRVTLRVPLRIYEPGSNQQFLVEEASAVKVSLWGGLVALRTAVNPNQKLFLANQATGETAESKVVYLGPMQLGGKRLRLVAVEFLRPSPAFWGMVFPTVDPCRSQTGENGNQHPRARLHHEEQNDA